MTPPPFHTENDYILLTLRCCADCGGNASFEDLRDYMEHHLDLNDADETRLESTESPRWHQILRNLKSNQKMGVWAEDIPGGFKITDPGLAYMHSQSQRMQPATPWKRTDRRTATRETVCAAWGGKILMQLRDTKQWTGTEIVRDLDSGRMTMTDFSDKYQPEKLTILIKTSKPGHP